MASPDGSNCGVATGLRSQNQTTMQFTVLFTLLCNMFRCLIISDHCVNKRTVGINFHISKTKERVVKCAAPRGRRLLARSAASALITSYIVLLLLQGRCHWRRVSHLVWLKHEQMQFFCAAYHPSRWPFRQRQENAFFLASIKLGKAGHQRRS